MHEREHEGRGPLTTPLGGLIVFSLDDRWYGLPIARVERVVRTVKITLLPKAPDTVLGLIDVAGRIVPVYDMRGRFRLPARPIALSDHILIARTARRNVAIVVDAVAGIVDGFERIAASEVLPDLEYLDGVAKLADGMVLIHDLDTFLSLAEEADLDRALESGP